MASGAQEEKVFSLWDMEVATGLRTVEKKEGGGGVGAKTALKVPAA